MARVPAMLLEDACATLHALLEAAHFAFDGATLRVAHRHPGGHAAVSAELTAVERGEPWSGAFSVGEAARALREARGGRAYHGDVVLRPHGIEREGARLPLAPLCLRGGERPPEWPEGAERGATWLDRAGVRAMEGLSAPARWSAAALSERMQPYARAALHEGTLRLPLAEGPLSATLLVSLR